MKLLFLTLFISVAFEARAGELRGVWKNNQGVRSLAKQKNVEAFENFTSALADAPFSGTVHYNIGNSFLSNKEFERALSEYQEAIRRSDSSSHQDLETRFRALFNTAFILAEQKKIDEALETYQRALEIKPDSLETKTNIELLSQQQGGGGGGDEDDKNQQNKDDKGKGKDKDKDKDDKKPQDPKSEGPKPTPKPFKSEDLTQQDVKRILEELKRQEEQIRARMQNEKTKDAPPGKDW